MYSKEFRESLNAVEAAREANIALEPARMTAEEKEKPDAACQPFRNDSDHTQNQTETPRSGGFAS